MNGTFTIPVDVATVPRDGEVIIDRWWIVKDEAIIIWGGFSPQCNRNRQIAQSLIPNVHRGAEARLIAAVYLGPRSEEGRYHPPKAKK